MKRTIILSILLFLLILSQRTFSQRVIVLVIDGARYSESFGAESTYMPKIWKNMKPLGTTWSNFRNEGYTLTNPGHASILSVSLGYPAPLESSRGRRECGL